MLFSCRDVDWVLKYSADVLTRTKSLGKKTNQLNAGMENPWVENLCLRVMWNCYKIHRGILAKREEFQLKSGSMPFCTVRMSSHMHKSAHVINWPVWSFSFQKTKQKHISTVSGASGFLQSSCSKQEKSLCTMDILSLYIWHLASVQHTTWLCKVSCLITRGKYTVLRLILPVSWGGCGILIPITGKLMFGGCRGFLLVGAFAFKKNFTWLYLPFVPQVDAWILWVCEDFQHRD